MLRGHLFLVHLGSGSLPRPPAPARQWGPAFLSLSQHLLPPWGTCADLLHLCGRQVDRQHDPQFREEETASWGLVPSLSPGCLWLGAVPGSSLLKGGALLPHHLAQGTREAPAPRTARSRAAALKEHLANVSLLIFQLSEDGRVLRWQVINLLRDKCDRYEAVKNSSRHMS